MLVAEYDYNSDIVIEPSDDKDKVCLLLCTFKVQILNILWLINYSLELQNVFIKIIRKTFYYIVFHKSEKQCNNDKNGNLCL